MLSLPVMADSEVKDGAKISKIKPETLWLVQMGMIEGQHEKGSWGLSD